MDSNRKFHYGKIHEAARQLELEDAAYRSVLYALTGKRSCTDLSQLELFRVNNFLGQEVAKRLIPTPKQVIVTDEEALEILGLL